MLPRIDQSHGPFLGRFATLGACSAGRRLTTPATPVAEPLIADFALEFQSAKVRVNVVSPPWVTETLLALKMDPSSGLPADEVARAFAQSVEGSATGTIIDAKEAAA